METNLSAEQRLDEIAEELFDYADEIKIIKDLFDALPVKQSIASPYLNFRDALFHYKKMYNAIGDKDEFTIIAQQSTCIEEHLNRGLKDFAIHLCNNYYIRIIHKMITSQDDKRNNKDVIKKLRNIYHGLKNLVVEIRHTGQTLQHFNNKKNTWLPKLVALIDSFNKVLNEHRFFKLSYNQFSRDANILAIPDEAL